MSEPLRFLGVLESQLGGERQVGEGVTIEYLGVSYRACVTARNEDFDDWGNPVVRYALEATGPA